MHETHHTNVTKWYYEDDKVNLKDHILGPNATFAAFHKSLEIIQFDMAYFNVSGR